MSVIGFVLLLFVNKLTAEDSVKVKTSEGAVIGFKAIDGNYFSFNGVPYGGDTSGEFRYKEAPPPLKYGELVANKTDIICAQPSCAGLIGVEDCLTLNIFTKSVNTTKPVIVWIGGENFSDTNSTRIYSYKTLVESDLVLIEVNYRLSIFGFLCLGVNDAPGNAGIKDVLKALNWINNNAKAFGGNSSNVILLGHGSGAAMVDLITLSHQAENLVHKAIVLSGSAMSPWAISYKPIENAKLLGQKLGINETDVNKLAKALKAADAEKMVEKINTFEFTDQSVPFAPCVENSAMLNSFLNDAPINKLKAKAFKSIPYIAGFVLKEGTIRLKEALDHKWLENMQKNLTDFLPADLKFSDESVKATVVEELRDFYFQKQNSSLLTSFLDFEGDSLIKYPIIRTILERAKLSNESVRVFRLDFQEDLMRWSYNNITVDGPRHGNILDYIFDAKSKPFDTQPKETLIERIVNFAKTGKPTGRNAWFAWTTDESNIFVIRGYKATFAIWNDMDGFKSKDKALWDKIMGSHYRVPTPVSSAANSMISISLLLICQILIWKF